MDSSEKPFGSYGSDLRAIWNRQEHDEVICTKPWTTMQVADPDGRVHQCCSEWTFGDRGNLNERTLLDIWNGPEYQAARAMMLGDTDSLCRPICPRLYDKKLSQSEFSIRHGSPAFVRNQLTIAEDISLGRTEVEGRPTNLTVCPSTYCNYDCIMCTHGRSVRRDLPESIWGQLEALLPTLSVLGLLGGEPLANPHCVSFLQAFDRTQYPDATVDLTTNGSLLTEKVLARMDGCHLGSVVISLNAGVDEVYQKVMRGLDLAEVLGNLDALLRYRSDQTYNFNIELSFVVQPANAHTLIEFGQLARSRDLDIRLLPLTLGGVQELDYYGDPTQVESILEQLDAFVRWIEAEVPSDRRAQWIRETEAVRTANLEKAAVTEASNVYESVWTGPTESVWAGPSKRNSPPPEERIGPHVNTVRAARGESEIACLAPWTSMRVGSTDGVVHQCSPGWTIGSRGNCKEQSLLDVWNGEGYSAARAMMLEDTSGLCRESCPHLHDNRSADFNQRFTDGPSEFAENQRLLVADMDEGRTDIEGRPLRLMINPSSYCQYDCIMCSCGRTPTERLGDDIWAQVGELLPTLMTLQISGGEPFADAGVVNFLASLDGEVHPVAVDVLTNGALLTPELLTRLQRCRFGSLGVSLNAGDAETYEAVTRSGVPFEQLVENIAALETFRDEHAYPFRLELRFVVMHENAHTLIPFAEIAHAHNIELMLMTLSTEDAPELDFYRDSSKVAEVLGHIDALAEWLGDKRREWVTRVVDTKTMIEQIADV